MLEIRRLMESTSSNTSPKLKKSKSRKKASKSLKR
jgi:hypothetical protein